MKTKIICKWCGKAFTPEKKSNRKACYCNAKCRGAFHNQEQRIRRQKDKDYREFINKQQREAYHRVKADRREKANAYRKKHRDKILAAGRESYHRNKDTPEYKATASRNGKKWYRKNKEKLKAKWNARMKEDVVFSLKNKTRTRISNAIRYYVKGLRKSNGTVELLGCSLSFFKKHIEKQFTKGMSWDEFLEGKIHLDHIKSCWSFDLSKVEEQKRCFNYKNVQPLWAGDNLSKNRF